MVENLENLVADTSENPELLTTFRYKLKLPRAEQLQLLVQSLGCQRWVYNQALAVQENRVANKEKRLPYKDLCSLLVEWKEENAWLNVSPSQSLQQTLAHLIRGFQAWRQSPELFDKPTFKKRNKKQESLVFPSPNQIVWDGRGSVVLPKLGKLKYFRDKRVVDGALRRATISRDGDDFYISFLVKNDSSCVRSPADIAKACGIDLGVVNRVALDDGSVFDFPEDDIAKLDEKIAAVQKWISHKEEMAKQIRRSLRSAVARKDISPAEKAALEKQLELRQESKTLAKLRSRFRKLHQRRRFILNNARHQITAHIARTYGTVYMEDLATKNMTKSAKGTKEKPGKNVKQKSGLNRQLLLTAPGEIRRQLEYKTARHGGKLVLVAPAYSSQTCPQCGHCEKANRPTRNNFICVKCGFAAPADKVGAMNVKAWGSAGTHLPIPKKKKTRPALISRKPKERKQDVSINPPEAAASG